MNKVVTFLRETGPGRFFIPVGIILIIFSIFTFKAVDHAKDFIKTEAIVTKTELYEAESFDVDQNRVEPTYTIFVKYEVEGIEYNEEYGIFPESGYKVGDKVTISYNPSNPKEIAQPNSIILPIVLFGLGAFSLVGGVISILNAWKRHKEMQKQEEGWKNGK